MTDHEKTPDRIYINYLPDGSDYVLVNPLIAPDPVEYIKVSEVRAMLERAAASHETLAKTYPSGQDAVKAKALRRFAEVFL